jgi:hypothetical protein
MPTLPEYKAGKAETCYVDRVTEQGAGREFFARLPDGYLINCGPDKARAEFLVASANVALKWAYEFPPVGVIESVVRHSFREEDAYGGERRVLVEPGVLHAARTALVDLLSEPEDSSYRLQAHNLITRINEIIKPGGE